MVSAGVLRAHLAHVLVFGLPGTLLAGVVGWQELRGRRAAARARNANGERVRPETPASSVGLR